MSSMEIEDMLIKLRTNRQSIARQIDVLNEIVSKSNNVLLQLEMERSKEITVEKSNFKAYSCERNCEHSLARIVELYPSLPLNEDDTEKISYKSGFANYLQHNCQNLSFLSSNVRKLLVVGEIMSAVSDNSDSN